MPDHTRLSAEEDQVKFETLLGPLLILLILFEQLQEKGKKIIEGKIFFH